VPILILCYRMPPGLTGVLINKIHPLTDTSRCLKRDDVILAFDGIPIANDGTGNSSSLCIVRLYLPGFLQLPFNSI
jgi:hypothetical protein